jgi:adenylate kinase family enzyme
MHSVPPAPQSALARVMKSQRIHIMGASGAGITTLGRATADALALPHHDTDDYFWLPTSPPYRKKRDPADRLRLMGELFLDRPDWVLSGSVEGWGDSIAPLFDLVIFLEAPIEVRLSRLRDRETRHFGIDAVSPGGWRHEETEDFVEWASHYEDGSREGKCLTRHLAWLGKLNCPVLRLDGTRPVRDLVREIAAALPK